MNEKPKQETLFFEGIHEDFRPERVPADWLIFNTARPLMGSHYPGSEDERATWTGDFHRGVFYAAVDPADPNADMWIRENNKQDAALCIWKTADEVVAHVKAYYGERYPDHDEDVYDGVGFDYFAQVYRDLYFGSIAGIT